jgi:hypothetical protein
VFFLIKITVVNNKKGKTMFNSKVMRALVGIALLAVIAASGVVMMNGLEQRGVQEAEVDVKVDTVVDSTLAPVSNVKEEKIVEAPKPKVSAPVKTKNAETTASKSANSEEGRHVGNFESEAGKRLFKDL